MPKILQNYHDAKLIIAGKGGMLDELKAQANSMGISNKVYFTGYLNAKQVQKIYKCADIAVFPSTYEPFGIVALEAMLAGVPTVVSDIGGLNEIVEHGVNGMKSYAGNPNSIADSVLNLLYDKQLVANGYKGKLINVGTKEELIKTSGLSRRITFTCNDDVSSLLSELDGVNTIDSLGDQYTIIVSKENAAKKGSEILDQQKIKYSDYVVSRPTLEDVFLHLINDSNGGENNA